MKLFKITASEVLEGDEIKTSDGFISVGGTQTLPNGKIGLFTPSGMLGVNSDDVLTVRRNEDAGG